jgi:hypothetical protein
MIDKQTVKTMWEAGIIVDEGEVLNRNLPEGIHLFIAGESEDVTAREISVLADYIEQNKPKFTLRRTMGFDHLPPITERIPLIKKEHSQWTFLKKSEITGRTMWHQRPGELRDILKKVQAKLS